MTEKKQNNSIKTCATCKYIQTVQHGEFYCGQTRLPIDLNGSCELYSSNDEPIIPKKINKISRYSAITTMLIIAILLVKFGGKIGRIKREKQFDNLVRVTSSASSNTMFLHSINREKKGNNLIMQSVYFSPSEDFSKSYFENRIKEKHTSVNDSLNSYDTIYMEDILFYSKDMVDSTLLIYKTSGYSIKSYKFRYYIKNE